MTPQPILDKIKFLLKLSESDNIHEAANAKAGADKLITKFNVTDEELSSIADKKAAYNEDDKLFHSTHPIAWKMQLALAIANKFDCLIVQEESVPAEGNSEFYYYIYGDSEDVESVKYAFNTFLFLIDDFVNKKCFGKGPIYIDSYTEGLVVSIKDNLQYGINIPERKKEVKKEEKLEVKPEALAHLPTEKEQPTKEKIDVSNSSVIKDVVAYFKGIADGGNVYFDDAVMLQEGKGNVFSESVAARWLPSEGDSLED